MEGKTLILNTALLCLALNNYHEARGETIIGQLGASQAVIERTDTNRRICEEVLKPKQFSWTKELVNKKTKQVTKDGLPVDKHSWMVSNIIGEIALSRTIPSVTGYAAYYHEKKRKPIWRKNLVKTAMIGNHIFYRERDKD